MRPDLQERIARVAADRQSGASEILDEVIAILRDAIAAGDDVAAVAAAVREAQPSMAPVWNAARAALASDRAQFERFVRRVERAPQALARFGSDVLLLGQRNGAPVHVVTLSYSRSVLHVLERIAGTRTVHAACAEGRPALEGRRMAERLTAAGIRVTVYTDAAIGQALEGGSQVLLGADAVTSAWFINKVGTGMLAAAAASRGLPVYVVASRDKLLNLETGNSLPLRGGAPAEVWDGPPHAVSVANPYFERVPLTVASAVISDAGVLGVVDVENLTI